jgi:uncharacterized protein (DUF302 family)
MWMSACTWPNKTSVQLHEIALGIFGDLELARLAAAGLQPCLSHWCRWTNSYKLTERRNRPLADERRIWLWRVYAMTADGLTTTLSSFGPKETMVQLEAEIKAKGMTVFARIDHAAGAAEAGLPLRPTEVLIFGSAKAGTPLLQAEQAIGIDLPLKALVFEDAAGKVWLSCNDPHWLATRHGLGAAVAQTVDAMAAALNAVATKATKLP